MTTLLHILLIATPTSMGLWLGYQWGAHNEAERTVGMLRSYRKQVEALKHEQVIDLHSPLDVEDTSAPLFS